MIYFLRMRRARRSPFGLLRSRSRAWGRQEIPLRCPYPVGSYWKSFRTLCWLEFACASIAVPACCMICSLLKLVYSCAMLVSRITDSAADTFWYREFRFVVAYPRRLSAAPMVPMVELSVADASPIEVSAAAALVASPTELEARPRPVVLMSPSVNDSRLLSPARPWVAPPEPTRNDAACAAVVTMFLLASVLTSPLKVKETPNWLKFRFWTSVVPVVTAIFWVVVPSDMVRKPEA